MRSHGIQKKAFTEGNETNYSTSDNFVFSKFEKYEIIYKGNETNKEFTDLPNYSKPTDTDTDDIDGSKKVEDFSEELKFQRRSHLKTKTASKFQVDLGYSSKIESNATQYQCVSIIFSYVLKGQGTEQTIEEKVTIQFETTGNQKLQIDGLDLDSDITEYLFRFTRGLDWGSETHGILDCNPNESVNKGVYFTLNAPFNENINWSSTSDKRVPIIAYRIFELTE